MPDASETWQSLLDRKRRELGISEADVRIADENQFRSAFEDLCEEHDEQRPHLRLNALEKLFKLTKAFVKAIDTANNHTEATGTLTGVFREAAFKSVKTALENKILLPKLISEIAALGKVIPAFGAELVRFTRDFKVQVYLQTIFSAYIECYKEMITHFATACPPLSYDPIHSSFDTATAIIKRAKEQWAQAFEIAVEREKERLLTSSLPSSKPNALYATSLPPVNAHFEVLDHLGDGTFGEVQKVREITTQEEYARKLVHVPSSSRHSIERSRQIVAEVTIMKKLQHHHIASCLFYVKEADYYSIIMLPIADYDLKRFLNTKCIQNNFDRAEITKLDNWFGCLVSALAFAHLKNIKHNDIKLSNILIKDDQPYLADFGSAADFSKLDNSTAPESHKPGTYIYYAPETDAWGRKADVFALGCVFSEMLTVRCRKSLDAYVHFRRPNAYPYNASLPKVHEWLHGLEEIVSRNEEHLKVVVEQTHKMVEGTKDKRPDAAAVKKRLRSQSDELFCLSC